MNCSIANQIARVQFAVFEKCASAHLSQIVRGKTCDYLLMMYTQKLDCFPLSRVYFVSCLTGSAACLCAFAGVVRVSKIELASSFYTSCHEKTERSFPLSVGYSLIAVTSIQGSSRLQSFTSLLRTIP